MINKCDKLYWDKTQGGIMLVLKDTHELYEYNYKVCEISGCEDESEELYEHDDTAIDLCHEHYREIRNKEYLL